MSDAPSLRETIESAMEADAATDVALEPVVEAPAPVEAAPEHEAAVETPAEAAARARDEAGRFKRVDKNEKPAATPEGVKKAAGEAVAAVKGKAAGVAPPPVSPAAKPVPEAAPFKAPQSWKPAMRELAAKLPPEFRPIVEESIRRDQETSRVMQESAQARQFASQVQQSLAPYELIARANGTDAMTFAGTALRDVAAIYSGAPQQAVAVVAGAVSMLQQRFGPQALDMINSAMEGRAAQVPQQMQQMAPPRDPRVDQLFARIERAQTQRLQSDINSAEEFLGAQEFGEDVRGTVADIIDVWAQQGKTSITQHDLQRAYDLACRTNEDVSKVLDARRVTEAARAQAPTVQRAKVAASSIRASPGVAAPRNQGPMSLRETIEAAAAAAQRT